MSLSKPSLILLAYVAVISVLLLGYIGAAGQQWHPPADLFGISFAGDLDLWVAGTVMIVGFAAIASGADKVPVCITGSLGTLIALTVMEDPLTRYMTLSALLFSIGVYGMTTSRNAVRVLMSIELMLNAVNINMVAFARYCDPAGIKGQIFAIFILTVAAAEAAVGLAIVLSIYRNSSTVDMEKFNLLKW